MKTIKIFLASSDELENDRMAFGNLVRRLDKIYEKRGIRIELFEWEDYDAAFNGMRKQDEYNEHIKESDLFLALFHTKAGKFTIEEFDIATEEFKKHAFPKVYTYCRDLEAGEQETPELTEFKRRLFEELGHYWCRYSNRDSMQLHFVMQLQLVESSSSDALKVENGQVTLDGTPVAKMENLPFVAGNEDYVKMQAELSSLPEKIEKARLRLEKFPDDEDLQDDLQAKLNRYNSLKEELEKHQELLFNTAKQVAQLQGGRITERMRRAMDAFNEGNVREANIILSEAEKDATDNLEDYKRSREVTEQKRQNVESSIDELKLKASTIMADNSIAIEERIKQAEKVYAQADEMAQEISLDKKNHDDLLREYGKFLRKYAKYDKAIEIYKREIAISEELYGLEHPATATSYNNIGEVYKSLSDYPKALEYFGKSLVISERVLGEEHPSTATVYNNIGLVYYHLGDYPKALEYYGKSLAISEKVLGEEHPDTALSYNNIGVVYDNLGDYPMALEYYGKSLAIREKVFGEEHPATATSYNNIGEVYKSLSDYPKALEYFGKSLVISERVLGEEHPSTATVYNNIGLVYYHLGDYPKALEYYGKSLAISEKVLGEEHPDTALSYNNIGVVYDNLGDYPMALEYYGKALGICERVFGKEHPSTATIHNNIGWIKQSMKDIKETGKLINNEDN